MLTPEQRQKLSCYNFAKHYPTLQSLELIEERVLSDKTELILVQVNYLSYIEEKTENVLLIVNEEQELLARLIIKNNSTAADSKEFFLKTANFETIKKIFDLNYYMLLLFVSANNKSYFVLADALTIIPYCIEKDELKEIATLDIINEILNLLDKRDDIQTKILRHMIFNDIDHKVISDIFDYFLECIKSQPEVLTLIKLLLAINVKKIKEATVQEIQNLFEKLKAISENKVYLEESKPVFVELSLLFSMLKSKLKTKFDQCKYDFIINIGYSDLEIISLLLMAFPTEIKQLSCTNIIYKLLIASANDADSLIENQPCIEEILTQLPKIIKSTVSFDKQIANSQRKDLIKHTCKEMQENLRLISEQQELVDAAIAQLDRLQNELTTGALLKFVNQYKPILQIADLSNAIKLLVILSQATDNDINDVYYFTHLQDNFDRVQSPSSLEKFTSTAYFTPESDVKGSAASSIEPGTEKTPSQTPKTPRRPRLNPGSLEKRFADAENVTTSRKLVG